MEEVLMKNETSEGLKYILILYPDLNVLPYQERGIILKYILISMLCLIKKVLLVFFVQIIQSDDQESQGCG